VRPRRHLVLFARAPMRGAVKSRLAAEIGKDAALAFYRRTLHDVLWRLGRDARWQTWLAVTPDSAAHDPALWPAVPGVALIPQGGGDLGARMARPLRELPPGPVVIVGSDIPDLGLGHVMNAFAALGRHDMVFGPARDGGYWLVGARRSPVVLYGLFRNVRWSGPHARADTLAGLPANFRVAMLEELDDIDDGADWVAWQARQRS
jgi:rSAM/selenodomain-associated transferase 1